MNTAINWDDAAEVEDQEPEKVEEKVETSRDGHPSPLDDGELDRVLSSLVNEAPTSEKIAADIAASKALPTEEEIAAAEALLARVGRVRPTTGQPDHDPEDPPVSNSREPIKLAIPDEPKMQTIDAGDVQIIARGDRIDVIRKVLGETVPELRVRESAPVAAKISSRTEAERAHGRKNLERHEAERAMFPPNQRTKQELDRERPSVPLIHAGGHPLQHMLNRPAKDGQGQGF